MKIPILYSPSNSKDKLSPYIELFFEYLQEDKEFEKLIKTARINVANYTGNIKPPKLKIQLKQYLSNKLDIVVRTKKHLRSENYNVKKNNDDLPILVYKPFSLELNKQIERILSLYTFLKDWTYGLQSFLLGKRFIISDENLKIKLRVKNKKYYLGGVEDKTDEEGVKIVITSKVSKTYLKNWVNNYYPDILHHLNNLPSLSYQDSRRINFERDRLVVYLRLKRKMEFQDIADIIQNKTNEQITPNALEKALKDFPLH